MNKKKLKTISRTLQVLLLAYLLVLLLSRQWTLFWISLLILAVLLIVFAFALVEFALNPACPFCMIKYSDYTTERTYPPFQKADAWFLAHEQKLQIQAADGTKLAASWIPHPGSKTCVILFHGYGNAADDAMCVYAQGFYDLGCSVLCPRARAHGDSGGQFVDMGALSPQDAADWIRYLQQKQPDLNFVLFGISMGASAAMLASGAGIPGVKALIEDCGYSSVKKEFTFQMKNLFALPAFPFLPMAAWAARLRTGMGVLDIDCIPALENSRIPSLFIHGDKDGFVPFEMLESNYAACGSSDKKKAVFEGARHGESVYKDPEKYWKTIGSFLKKYGLTDGE